MTVNVSKPAINVREKLAELDKPTGIAGEAMLRAETPQEQFNLIGAGRRNLIINGAMKVAQRGTSFTGLGTAVTYTLDRWRFADSANPPARYTQTQSTDAPEGFSNSLKMEVTTADTSVDADELQNVDYFIEAQDLQHLGYGSSSAKDITLSFWVKCSVAQTFGFRLQHEDAGGSYTKSYTVNAANTWEYKTLTFPANTSTNFANDNGRGFRLRWGMCAGTDHTGSDSTAWGNGNTFGLQENTWVGTTGNTWQITGVQLEVGKVATPFEHRSYGEELALCQRYYQRLTAATNNAAICTTSLWTGGTSGYGVLHLPTELRTAPTVSVSGTFVVFSGGGTTNVTSVGGGSNFNGNSVELVFNHSAIGSAGDSAWIRMGATGNYVALDAEL